MTKITNKSQATQGVHTIRDDSATTEIVWLRPGETRDDLSVSDAELAHMRKLPFYDVDGQSAPVVQAAQDEAMTTALEDLQEDHDALQQRWDALHALAVDHGIILVGLKTKHKGAGSYSVMSDDEELVTGLTNDAAREFDAMDDVAQTLYVEKMQKASA